MPEHLASIQKLRQDIVPSTPEVPHGQSPVVFIVCQYCPSLLTGGKEKDKTGLVAHAIISALGEWRPEDPLEFKIILGSEFAASPGLNETLSKTKHELPCLLTKCY